MPLIPFQIQIQNLSKSFHEHSVFKNVNLYLLPNNRLVINGPNGSGKSTFLKVFTGKMKPSSGKVTFSINSRPISEEFFYQYIAWDAPYMDIYPYFNIQETFYWHFQFVKPILRFNEWVDILDLKSYQFKELKYLSSGTLQRVKVGLALFSNTPILILDEPTANMDNENSQKIIELVQNFSKDRILLIASNLLRETEWIKNKHSENYFSELLTFSLF